MAGENSKQPSKGTKRTSDTLGLPGLETVTISYMLLCTLQDKSCWTRGAHWWSPLTRVLGGQRINMAHLYRPTVSHTFVEKKSNLTDEFILKHDLYFKKDIE